IIALLAALLIAAVAAVSALAVPSAGAATRRQIATTRLRSCTGHVLTRPAGTAVLARGDGNTVTVCPRT
ncbi:MAG: hypothetical protein ACP5H2_09355, partial [Solirubrobacteraceae bacterium]